MSGEGGGQRMGFISDYYYLDESDLEGSVRKPRPIAGKRHSAAEPQRAVPEAAQPRSQTLQFGDAQTQEKGGLQAVAPQNTSGHRGLEQMILPKNPIIRLPSTNTVRRPRTSHAFQFCILLVFGRIVARH